MFSLEEELIKCHFTLGGRRNNYQTNNIEPIQSHSQSDKYFANKTEFQSELIFKEFVQTPLPRQSSLD